MTTEMFLDVDPEGREFVLEHGTFPAVIYSCVVDGELSWESVIPDDQFLLSKLNGSYDTYDRRFDTLLSKEDYPVALAAEEDGDASTSPASWWKRVFRRQ